MWNVNHSRSRTRKFLYQMLYASTFWKIQREEFIDVFFTSVFNTSIDTDYLNEMFDIILDKEDFLESILNKYAPKFNVKDMDMSYILPVYIGLAELLFYQWEIPVKVCLNEAIEISKMYWDDSSKRMVHGVMDNLLKDLNALEQEKNNYNFSWKNNLFIK